MGKESELQPNLEFERTVGFAKEFVGQIGLSGRIAVSSGRTRKGELRLDVENNGNVVSLAPGGGLEKIAEEDISFLIKTLARSFGSPGRSVGSDMLMEREEFSKASVERVEKASVVSSELFSNINGVELEGRIPVVYGSTGGINAAEVMETLIIAEDADARFFQGTGVVFEYSGADSEKSREVLKTSLAGVKPELRADVSKFIAELGHSGEDQLVGAAKTIFSGKNISFVEPGVLNKAVGEAFTLGKLAVIAKLAGENPRLFEDLRASELIKSGVGLDKAVSDVEMEPAGFTYYAREAVIGADIPGHFISPVKLTDKGNIYKILGNYNSLASQNIDRGVILAPIRRHRIQTKSQIEKGVGDPFDIRVLAYLAVNFRGEFDKLTTDFLKSCKVLRAEEAVVSGTSDVRFSVNDYFKEVMLQ